MPNYLGRDYVLYIASTAPTSPEDHTDGNYTKVGLVQNLAIGRSRNAIDKSNKDDGNNSTFVGGRRNENVSGDAVFDHTSDAGQAVIDTVMDSADGSCDLLLTTATASDREFYGSAVITQEDFSFPDDGPSALSFAFQITGALTVQTGT